MSTQTTVDISELAIAHDEASTTLGTLEREQVSIAEQMRQAAFSGDADRYCELKARRHELPDRIPIARLVFAETGLELYREQLEAAETHDAEHPTTAQGRYGPNGEPLRMEPLEVRMLRDRVDGFRLAVEEARRELMR